MKILKAYKPQLSPYTAYCSIMLTEVMYAIWQFRIHLDGNKKAKMQMKHFSIMR